MSRLLSSLYENIYDVAREIICWSRVDSITDILYMRCKHSRIDNISTALGCPKTYRMPHRYYTASQNMFSSAVIVKVFMDRGIMSRHPVPLLKYVYPVRSGALSTTWMWIGLEESVSCVKGGDGKLYYYTMERIRTSRHG